MVIEPASRPSGQHSSSNLFARLDRLARNRAAMTAVLVLVCLSIYLPGAVRLPAVDRTEIVYAETTRDMVERGAWFDPRFGETAHQFRPIGTYWLQGAAAAIAGPDLSRSITVYRIPSVISVTLAVVAVYWLIAPLVGAAAAAMAAGLFAVAPLTVLVSQLAITEGLSLLPAVVAILALLRIYAAHGTGSGTGTGDAGHNRLAIGFWLAIGFGMVLNALLVPIFVAATLLALWLMDRDVSWLRRTRPLLGAAIALALASPWIIVRVLQDGVPFSGLSFNGVIEALGGSQDMKLRAFPGTFILALLLGFLPGTALVAPAVLRLWSRRDHDRVARFLLASVIGYLVYLEALSSKPGTYTVQVLFPALAIAVAMLVRDVVDSDHHARGTPPKWHAIPWPPIAAIFAATLFAAVYGITGERPTLLAVILIAAVAGLFFASARVGRANDLVRWWVSGTAALALFAISLLGFVLPSLDTIWPARQIARSVSALCPNSAVPPQSGLLGFREPSGIFVLNAARAMQSPEAIAQTRPPLRIVEARWLDRYKAAVTTTGGTPGRELGCVSTVNVMRGCSLTFHIFADEATAACAPSPAVASCNAVSAARTISLDKSCD